MATSDLEARIASLESTLNALVGDPRISRRLTAGPPLAPTVADTIKQVVQDVVSAEQTQTTALLAGIHAAIADLPAAIAEALKAQP